MTDKIKIFTISDHPLSPSGVGTQTKYMIEGMLKTGKYQFVSFGGAMTHPEGHQPQKTEQWGEDWVIWPVDGYGTADMVRGMIHQHKPDILWFMTDPRFYGWLWEVENEIRTHLPMVYYHVWDNYPYPNFNRKFYLSNDHIACISKLTHDIVQTVTPEVPSTYLPHAVDSNIFKPLDEADVLKFRKDRDLEDKFICVWNNRNARRKQSGTLVWWFKEFLDEVGHENACLIMHTDPHDVHGQDLTHLMRELDMTSGQLLLSVNKIQAHDLNIMYNMADVTINISDAEGFGLSTLESMSTGTPIIVNRTGGLQDQITDGTTVFGVGIDPASKAVIGSQQVPYIYEDRINKEDFLAALHHMYNMDASERRDLGLKAREWATSTFNFENYINGWDKILTEVHETCGSWETRKNYTSYRFGELK